MVPLAWGDQYKTGVDFIDESHERIFRLINALELPRRKAWDPISKEALAALLDYAGRHFREEEELMLFTRYPGYGAHQADHQKAVAWIHDLEKKSEEGRLHPRAIAKFAGQWMSSHLQEFDFPFIQWVRSARSSRPVENLQAL